MQPKRCSDDAALTGTVLTAILWASFLLMQGVMIWVSALLFIVAGGTCIFSFLFCETEY